MTKNIPYKFYKLTLMLVWILAALNIVATWVGFAVANTGALVFGAIIDCLLFLAVAALVVLLWINGREDYKKRAYIFGALALVHLIFFVLVLALKGRMEEGNNGLYALPAVHTLILLGIAGVGVYFWIRNKYTFKTANQEDAHAAFGGPVDEPKKEEDKPLQPEEPKPARDEKTGIVSL